LNSQVLAISCDPIAAKQAWGRSLGGIRFPLVSDFWPHGQVASAYGVFDREFGRSARATFVVDKAGVIRWSRVYELGILPEEGEILEQLRSINRE
jgi:alkyl hydroperoxide reductase subunit AhpC